MRILILTIITFSMNCTAQSGEDFDAYLQELAAEFAVPQLQADSMITDRVVLLDTREYEEFLVSHLPDAIWIGYDDFDLSRLDSLKHDQSIVVYCSVGYRSSKIAEILQEAGYNNVYNLYGGIFKWANDGRSLIKDENSTNKIHAYNRFWGRYINNPDVEKVY